MNTRVLLAALAGGVAAFLLGWLIYGFLVMDLMRSVNPQVAGYEKAEPELWALALSNIVWALLYALVFSRWAQISTFISGAVGGAWMAVLIALSIDLYFIAATNIMSFNGLLVDVVVNAVMGAAVGGVVGWVLGYRQGN